MSIRTKYIKTPWIWQPCKPGNPVKSRCDRKKTVSIVGSSTKKYSPYNGVFWCYLPQIDFSSKIVPTRSPKSRHFRAFANVIFLYLFRKLTDFHHSFFRMFVFQFCFKTCDLKLGSIIRFWSKCEKPYCGPGNTETGNPARFWCPGQKLMPDSESVAQN